MARVLIVTTLLLAAFPTAAGALPPRPPSAAKTTKAIERLKVAEPLSMEGYSRAKFPHWISQEDGCNTRGRC